jgi:hypothetical protein
MRRVMALTGEVTRPFGEIEFDLPGRNALQLPSKSGGYNGRVSAVRRAVKGEVSGEFAMRVSRA